MKQDDLLAAVAAQAGTTKADTDRVLKALGAATQAELNQGGEVTLPGIAKIGVKTRPARKGRNPGTGAEIDIAASNAAKFTPLKALKDALNS
jgi:DNA-binding protein HU-beta